MHLMYMDYLPFSDTFQKIQTFIRYTYSQDKRFINKLIEKTAIRWFTMDTLINCIENKVTPPILLRGVFLKTIENNKEQLQFLSK